MNLRIYIPEIKDEDGKVTTEGVERILGPIHRIDIEFLRGVAHVTHPMKSGVPVTESFELSWLFPGDTSNFLFESFSQKRAAKESKEGSGTGHLVDPTTVPTGNLTGQVVPKDSAPSAQQNVQPKLTEAQKEQFAKDKIALDKAKAGGPEVKPATHEVKAGSAVGHLIDPVSKDTSGITSKSKLDIPDATQNRQGTEKDKK